jgi:hypothetical protein
LIIFSWNILKKLKKKFVCIFSFSLCHRLFLCFCLLISLCLPLCLSLFLSFSLSPSLSVCLSIYLSLSSSCLPSFSLSPSLSHCCSSSWINIFSTNVSFCLMKWNCFLLHFTKRSHLYLSYYEYCFIVSVCFITTVKMHHWSVIYTQSQNDKLMMHCYTYKKTISI